MSKYASLTKHELICLLELLEETNRKPALDMVESLRSELLLHQEELDQKNQELRSLSATLEESRDHYARLYNFAPVGFLSLDRAGLVEEVNATFCHFVGYERQDVVGFPFHVYLEPLKRRDFLDVLRSVWESHRSITADFTLTHRAKSVIDVQLTASLVHDPQTGERRCWISVTDITDRKQAEQLVRESRANISAVIENTDDLIWSVDKHYRIITFNAAFNRMRRVLQHTQNTSLLSSPGSDSLLSKWKGLYDRALAGEKFSVEQSMTLKGLERTFELSFNPIQSGGPIVGVSIFGKDITERKALAAVLAHAKEQAESLSTHRATLLSSMSHELRTPLSAMLSYATLIRETTAKESVREWSDIIERNGKRLIALIERSLELAKIEAGRVAMAPEPLDLASLVERQCELLRPLAQQRGLFLKAMHHHSSDENMQVTLDAGVLEQILTNLIGNAIKFTNSGGIMVETSVRSDRIELRVRDTGIGIAKQFLPDVFKEFRRVHTPEQGKLEGAGLGLAITKRLVELLGGEIGVESDSGKGSLFWVRLPRSETRAAITELPLATSEVTASPSMARVTDSELEQQLFELQNRRVKHPETLASRGFEEPSHISA